MSFQASTLDHDFLRRYGLHQKKKKNEWFALCEHTIMDFIEMLAALHLDTILKKILC